MSKNKLCINGNNLYVQAVRQVIKEFWIEEASGCSYTAERLSKNIQSLQETLAIERKHMTLNKESIHPLATLNRDNAKCEFVYNNSDC